MEFLQILLGAFLIGKLGPKIVQRSMWGAVIMGAVSYFGSKSEQKAAKEQQANQFAGLKDVEAVKGKEDRRTIAYKAKLDDYYSQLGTERRRNAFNSFSNYSTLPSDRPQQNWNPTPVGEAPLDTPPPTATRTAPPALRDNRETIGQ